MQRALIPKLQLIAGSPATLPTLQLAPRNGNGRQTDAARGIFLCEAAHWYEDKALCRKLPLSNLVIQIHAKKHA